MKQLREYNDVQHVPNSVSMHIIRNFIVMSQLVSETLLLAIRWKLIMLDQMHDVTIVYSTNAQFVIEEDVPQFQVM